MIQFSTGTSIRPVRRLSSVFVSHLLISRKRNIPKESGTFQLSNERFGAPLACLGTLTCSHACHMLIDAARHIIAVNTLPMLNLINARFSKGFGLKILEELKWPEHQIILPQVEFFWKEQ